MSLERELALRLADIAEMLKTAAERINHREWESGDCSTLIRACDFALRGESGCWEPEELNTMREKALSEHAESLGLTPGPGEGLGQAEIEKNELRALLIEAMVKLHQHVVHAGLNFEHSVLIRVNGGDVEPLGAYGWGDLWRELHKREQLVDDSKNLG